MKLRTWHQHALAALITVPSTLAVIVADESRHYPAPVQFEEMARPSWNWKGALSTYAGGIAFDHITTEVAKAQGAVEQNPHRQTLGGNLATDAAVLAGAMGADYLLHRLHPKAPRFLRVGAAGTYATRGGLNLQVAFGW